MTPSGRNKEKRSKESPEAGRSKKRALAQKTALGIASRAEAREGHLRQRGRTCRRTGGQFRPQRPAGIATRKDRSQWVSRPTRREAQAEVGIRIKAMRENKGWSQEQFATMCGIDRSLLGMIERGNKNFRLSTLLPIAKQLESTVAELFVGIA